MELDKSTETVVTVEVRYGSRGPIVTADEFSQDGKRYEIVRVVSTNDGVDSRLQVWGLPVRADGERKSNAMYPSPVYGDEAETQAMLMLSRCSGVVSGTIR